MKFAYCRKDFIRYCQIEYGSNSLSLIQKTKVIFFGYGLQVLGALRFYQWSLKRGPILIKVAKLPLVLIGYILFRIFQNMYDIKISSNAQIGPGCYIGHFGGIRIGQCEIGPLCNINHQVTIGAMQRSSNEGPVRIGERVWVGAHSQILAGSNVGEGVIVAAGTVLNVEVPKRVTVIGPNARILEKEIDNSAILGLID